MLAFVVTFALLAAATVYIRRQAAVADGDQVGVQWARPLVVAVVVCGAVVLLVGAALGWLTAGLACGGDGGSPYAAPASGYGRYCGSHSYTIAFALPLIPVLLGGALVARRGRWRFLAVGVVVAAALAISPLLAAWALPDTCSEEAAKPGWRSAGPGDPDQLRFECQHY